MPRPRPAAEPQRNTQGQSEPRSWGGALAFMVSCVGVLWAVEIANAIDGYGLNRFGLRPRELAGLWGILTAPFLHASAWQLLSSTGPFVLIGWVLLFSIAASWTAWPPRIESNGAEALRPTMMSRPCPSKNVPSVK